MTASNDTSQAPYIAQGNAEPAVTVERRDNGEIILSSPYPCGPLPRSGVHLLLERAAEFPDRILIAERQADAWQYLTYAEAVAGCRHVAQWLLDQGASVQRPLAILSGSSIKHFLMAWGALFARVPYVPVSLSYSSVAGALPKLDAVLQRVNPAFVFAEEPALVRSALGAITFNMQAVQLISGEAAAPDGVVSWQTLLQTPVTAAVDESINKINHKTITRYMFTSGSTGMPKGVIHTQGMNCQMLASNAAIRDTVDAPTGPRVLDWMPWSHVGAGVMRLAIMIDAGGSIYLDTGKPTPAEFWKTIDNIKVAKPTSFAGAPLGWSMLVDALEADANLATGFYQHIRAMQAGSAAMPASLERRIQALNVQYTGFRFPFGTSLASTEVQCCLSRYWVCERDDVTGLPTPGAEIKLVPFGDKYELRVRSAGTTPGYLNDPDKTRESFDAEGFFRMGDAVRFADPADPVQGLCFAGRVAEEFKLVSGTWVAAGSLRAEAVTAASPYVRDVVVCGLNQAFVALLVWPNLQACATLAGTADTAALLASPAVSAAIKAGFDAYNKGNAGSSKRIQRFLLLATPPDPGANEITDKGYVNQAAAQLNRHTDVEKLFSLEPGVGVVVL